MSALDRWFAYAVGHGITFEDASRDDVVRAAVEDADYYAREGFSGLASLAQGDQRAERQKAEDQRIVNARRY